MNQSRADAQWTPSGYRAVYWSYRSSKPEMVTGADHKPILYRTEDKAKIAAYEALFAEENKLYALRFDPTQIKETPKHWQVVKPKSFAGKRAVAESAFKQRTEA